MTSRNPKRRKGFCVLCLHRRRRRRLALSPDRPTLSGLASCFSAYPSLPATKGEGKERFCLPLHLFFYAPPLFTSILHAFPEKSKTLFHSELASMR